MDQKIRGELDIKHSHNYKKTKYIGKTIRGMYITGFERIDDKDIQKDIFYGTCTYCGKSIQAHRPALTTHLNVSICECKRPYLYHRMSKTRIYSIYAAIKDRTVLNSSNPDFIKYYKNRGIPLCEEWQGKEGFMNFYKWSMENGYADNLSIDRIDVDKGYSPDNCRWADNHTQACNKRDTWKETIDGVEKAVADWCIDYHIDYSVVRTRVRRQGWDILKALSTPISERHRNANKPRRVGKYDLNGNLLGEYSSPSEAASLNGVSAYNIRTACQGHVPNSYGFIWKYL